MDTESVWDRLRNQKGEDEIMRELMEVEEEPPKETYPRPCRTSVHYHYIPIVPRNLPYMRRSY